MSRGQGYQILLHPYMEYIEIEFFDNLRAEKLKNNCKTINLL